MEPNAEGDFKPRTAANAFWGWLKAGVGWRYRGFVQRLRFVTRRLPTKSETDQYLLENGRYDAERYWADRHNRYRHSFLGVGDISRSEDENIQDYVLAVKTLTALLGNLSFDPRGRTALDIGCGNGFWTAILQRWGIASYIGVDITDALFDLLRERHPAFTFVAGKFEHLALSPGFELISMIDVTQHITDDAELAGVLTRIRALMAAEGIFIVTFWNAQRSQESFYEVFRPFSFYTTVLAGMAHTRPVRFRDKFVAAFFNPERRADPRSAPLLPRESIVEVVRQITAT